MLITNVFGDPLFDEMFGYPWQRGESTREESRKAPAAGRPDGSVMRTDIFEGADSYEVEIELPGYKKEDIKIKLEEGYLTVSAMRAAQKGAQDEGQSREGSYIRRERYAGGCSRTFYVGDVLRPEDIRAKYEDGVLKLFIPKKEKKQVQENKHISIEG